MKDIDCGYITDKLDALNGAIDAIHQQSDDTAFSKSMRSLLVVRLERERDRLLSTLPMMSQTT